MAKFEPMLLVRAMVAVSTSYVQPYRLVRDWSTLDHLSEERVGEWMFSFSLVLISVFISWGSGGEREVEGAGRERTCKEKADDA